MFTQATVSQTNYFLHQRFAERKSNQVLNGWLVFLYCLIAVLVFAQVARIMFKMLKRRKRKKEIQIMYANRFRQEIIVSLDWKLLNFLSFLC